MKFKKVVDKGGTQRIAFEKEGQWNLLENGIDLLELLDDKQQVLKISQEEYLEGEYKELIPFKPVAYRDFMLYEQHAIDAARGFVKKYMSHLFPIVSAYEMLLGKPFPKLKPKKRYYQHPIYYMGNHLNFISNDERIHIPAYTQELDYELELAAIITKPLKNASIDEVDDAIGGFVILNDFSARDVQLDEIESGFGPMKTKNFGSAISSVVVSKDEIISRLDDLTVRVVINDQTIIESQTKGKRYSFQEAIAYASWEEQLHPGELFGSGTIPGCSGIENGVMLKRGDTIRLEVEGIGTLTNIVE
ncbi:MAG: fumarylacetoacetate hydrolase family protein [Bacteroidia bacterium]